MTNPVRQREEYLLQTYLPVYRVEDNELPSLRDAVSRLEDCQPLAKEIKATLERSNLDEKTNETARQGLDPIAQMHQVVDFNLNLLPQMESLSCIADSSITSLDDTQQQLLSLKIIKSIFLTVSQAIERGDLDEKELCPVRTFVAFLSNCSIKKMISESDHPHLSIFFKEIVECQALIRALPKQADEETGESKGVLLRITKDGQIRGWIFGTMHWLETKNMEKAAKLSASICQKLRACAILGTEIKISKGTHGDSIENCLVASARRHGIFNMGLDSSERDKGLDVRQIAREHDLRSWAPDEDWVAQAGVDPKWVAAMNELVELRKQRNAKLDRMAIPYREGDIDALKKAFEEAKGESSKESEVELNRQTCLIENIDACLKGLEKVGTESDEEFPKGFFGVGAAHVISDFVGENRTVPNLVDGLRQKGWELEFERG